MRKIALTALLSAVTAAPLAAHDDPATPPVWVVRGDGSAVYMVGTVHMMRDEDAWRQDVYTDLVSKADEVWLEIAGISSPPPEMFSLITRYGMSPDRPLSEVLDETDLAALTDMLGGYGIPMESYEDARPWFVYLQLTGLVLADAGFDPGGGIDVFIEAAAEARDVPVRGFETFEEQFSVLAGMDEDTQVEILRQLVFESDQAVEELLTALDAWTSGDLSSLEAFVDEMYLESPGFYDSLLIERNHGVVDGIEAILDGEGTALVAVGLAHFVGPESIPAILEERGYVVEYR